MSVRIHPRQAEAFRAVMLAGGFRAAAQLLHVTQPAISRLVRDFEAEVGFQLFQRERNRTVPSEEAVLLFHEVEQLYVGLEQIGRAAQDIRTRRGGILRVGSVTSLNGLCMRSAIPEFARRFPDVTVIFDTESTERVFDLVAIRHYDLGFVYGESERSELPTDDLGAADAVAVMSRDHPLAVRQTIEIGDLSRARLILPGRRSPLRRSLDRALRLADIVPHAPVEASLSNCCTLAQAGIGVAIVDPLIAHEFGAGLVVRLLRPSLPLSYRIVRSPQAARSQLTTEFAASLRAAASEAIRASSRISTFPASHP